MKKTLIWIASIILFILPFAIETLFTEWGFAILSIFYLVVVALYWYKNIYKLFL